ncbi:hypothetical protein AB7W87_10860 [Providencia alcalifaciens]
MYSTGTVTTTANSTKLVGTGTKWLNNINRVSAEQAIQIQIGTTVYNNSIQSIQSDTELTLNFPLPTSATGAKYVILTTMVHSVSDAMNKIVSMNGANVQFSDILTRWMTEQGIITVTLPDQTTQQLRTTKEMDKQLDGKLNTNCPAATGDLTLTKSSEYLGIALIKNSKERAVIETLGDASSGAVNIIYRDKDNKNISVVKIPKKTGTTMLVGDSGLGAKAEQITNPLLDLPSKPSGFYLTAAGATDAPGAGYFNYYWITRDSKNYGTVIAIGRKGDIWTNSLSIGTWLGWVPQYSTLNTTKDSNGNLKAASPVVKLFADDIELNEESEGVEMEHLGIGHYLIKGVVGFNADGAWGINNGFVIPQDHNGKNMVLIDYEVRPDGDIEVFVFHQQNADMPERFQNKRIKHFDEEGVPVYFENYEPCDVPESRWIDMRVEMPPNSLYNQKQAEAERLAKIEAERLAQEEAKRIAEEKGA